jgi:hypothetical protein
MIALVEARIGPDQQPELAVLATGALLPADRSRAEPAVRQESRLRWPPARPTYTSLASLSRPPEEDADAHREPKTPRPRAQRILDCLDDTLGNG